jgi:hypothetical protein
LIVFIRIFRYGRPEPPKKNYFGGALSAGGDPELTGSIFRTWGDPGTGDEADTTQNTPGDDAERSNSSQPESASENVR